MKAVPIVAIGPASPADLVTIRGERFFINQNFERGKPPYLVAIDGLRNSTPMWQSVGIFNQHTVHPGERGQVGVLHRPYWSESHLALCATALFYPGYDADIDALLADPNAGMSAELTLAACRALRGMVVYDLVSDIRSCDPCIEPLGGGRFVSEPLPAGAGQPSPGWAAIYAAYVIPDGLRRLSERAAAALEAAAADLDNAELGRAYRRAYGRLNATRKVYFARVRAAHVG